MLTRSYVKPLFFVLSICCIAIVVSVTLVVRSSYQEYHHFRTVFAHQSIQENERASSREWIKRNLSDYQAFEDNGFTGDVTSISWLAFLADLGAQVPVEHYQFELDTSLPLPVTDDITVHRVPIIMHGNLIHDGLLIDVFGFLDQHAPGMWLYEALEVVRQESVPDSNSQKPAPDKVGTLKFTLRIVWLVLDRGDHGASLS